MIYNGLWNKVFFFSDFVSDPSSNKKLIYIKSFLYPFISQRDP
jgi:hypothetical protein